ncbi:MAG: thioredoxin domain-containing protein [Bacteroidales bacterium]
MNSTSAKTNHLANESSPYLLMHAHNPVDWYPWGEEAFKIAKTENKLLIVSIGYSACHWCHVMEKESFSDDNVAQIMNRYYISIKVDREERPDIDKIYMDAAQLITGRGGWPLNAITLPDGKPVYAATYFPKIQWIEVLGQIHRLFETNRDKLVQHADEITKGILLSNSNFVNLSDNSVFETVTIHELFRNVVKSIDFENGGLNTAPKFPMPVVFEYLLHYFHQTNEKKALEAVSVTLDKIGSGGIYDQIGGGFARYSTDEYWRIPHFEKMLYDNAQLVSLYSDAYKITKNELYARVIEESLEFIQREMTSPETGFYSAIDADSEGEEGKFYVWDYNEFREILQNDEDFLLDYYSLKNGGNWEYDKNILYRTMQDEAFILEKKLSKNKFRNSIKRVKEKLLNYRITRRVRPLTDTKIIASWNALMIKGYLDAYGATGNEDYLKTAIKNGHFIIRKLLNSEGNLYRNFKDGKSYTNAMLDDYANVVLAFIFLYQSTFDENWLDHANTLLEYTLKHFYNAKSGMFYFTSDLDQELITRQYEIDDQVIPSSNSVMALNLYFLGTLFDNSDYIKMAGKMLSNVYSNLINSSVHFANWAKLHIFFVSTPFEVAILGEKCMEFNTKLHEQFFPNIILTGAKEEGKLALLQHKLIKNQTSIYICKDKTCRLPMNDLDEALNILKIS